MSDGRIVRLHINDRIGCQADSPTHPEYLSCTTESQSTRRERGALYSGVDGVSVGGVGGIS